MRRDLPADCALAFAIPFTREEFFEEALAFPRKEYAHIFRAQLEALSDGEVWSRYESAVVQPALECIEYAESAGVSISRRTDPDALRNILRGKRVISLVAHWRPELQSGGLELSSGIHSAEDLVAMAPEDYTGTFDLRMCNSIHAGETMKRAFPRSTILMNSDPVSPSVQLILYRYTLKLLQEGSYDFAGAVAALRIAILRRAQ